MEQKNNANRKCPHDVAACSCNGGGSADAAPSKPAPSPVSVIDTCSACIFLFSLNHVTPPLVPVRLLVFKRRNAHLRPPHNAPSIDLFVLAEWQVLHGGCVTSDCLCRRSEPTLSSLTVRRRLLMNGSAPRRSPGKTCRLRCPTAAARPAPLFQGGAVHHRRARVSARPQS